MATISKAASELPSAEAWPRTRTRSPACKSCTWIGVAFLRSFSPGAIRRMRALGWTVTVMSGPESGVSVKVLPLIALIAPIFLANGAAGVCWACTGNGTVAIKPKEVVNKEASIPRSRKDGETWGTRRQFKFDNEKIRPIFLSMLLALIYLAEKIATP